MVRIAIINQKGGVGKTTTSANLGVALARAGQRTLLVDLDPQAHLTMHLGVDPDDDHPNMYTLMTRGVSLSEIRRTLEDRLSLCSAHRNLAGAETELISIIGRETILRNALLAQMDDVDHVIIDCPPSLGILSLNGLCAASSVIIPMQAHFLALQGVSELLKTVHTVQRRINPELSVEGVLMCMYESSTRLSSEVVQDLVAFFEQESDSQLPWSHARVFQTMIRRNIKLAESPSHGLSVFDYAPKSHGAEDYLAFAHELLGIKHDSARPTTKSEPREDKECEPHPLTPSDLTADTPHTSARSG